MKKGYVFTFAFVLFHACHASLERVEESTPPFLFANFRPYLYFGQDLDAGITHPNDSYSLFQYILDLGIEKKHEPVQFSDTQTISLSAKGRIKGLVGNRGSGRFPVQETKKFQGWLREGFLLYTPSSNKNSFLQAGYFPFKLGNGLVFGNAYNINIPIAWQFIYEQIDQFRPGILLQVGNIQQSVTGQAYVGFTPVKDDFDSAISPTLREFLAPLLDSISPSALSSKNTPNIVAAFQLMFRPFEQYDMQLCPYLFFQRSNQTVEIPNDATCTLYTPGIFASFKYDAVKISLELAKNCGQQTVKPLDRNLIPNAYLSYDNQQGATPATVKTSDLIVSPFVLPEAATTPAGNGGVFTFPTSPGTTSVFKNAYDRFRRSYVNTYAGFMAYADFVMTCKHVTWAVAGLYTSGDNNPNDSYDTLLMTRLTPGVTYKDINKTYKGFIGTNQYYEVNYLNPLYYGTGDFAYSNLAFVGTTFEYRWGEEEQPLTAQFTIVGYTKPFTPAFNITNHQGTTMTDHLSRYLGLEINYSATYTTHSKDVTLSLLGGVFFPGSYFDSFKKQLVTLEANTILVIPQDGTIHPITDATSPNKPFFISFGVTWLFDFLPSTRTMNHD